MNQKVSTVFIAILSVAVFMLFILHFTGTAPVKSTPAPVSANDTVKTPASSGDGFPIVYVDLDSLVQNYKLFKEFESKFNSKQMNHEQKFNMKKQKLEEDAYNLQMQAQKGLITSADYKTQATSLQAREQELMMEGQKLSKDLDEEEYRMLKEVKDSVIATVKDYNKTKNFEIILNNAYSSSILHAKAELNISDTIEVLLNLRYDQALEKQKK